MRGRETCPAAFFRLHGETERSGMTDRKTTEKKRISVRSLWQICPGRHAVLAVSLVWLAAYFLLRKNASVMNALCRTLVRPWHAFAADIAVDFR